MSETTNSQNSKKDLLASWLTLMENAGGNKEVVRLPVLSGSMLPDIPLNATLVIAPCTASEVQRGQVIVFQDGNRLVAHRLLLHFHIGPWQVLFQKGDSNAQGGWLSPDQVKGKVLEVEREHDTITATSGQAASSSLLQLFRNLLRNPGLLRR